MTKQEKRNQIFSSYPIPKAVASLAVPCVLSSLVNVIYNMADTFFVGMTHDTNQVAAVSLTMPAFLFFVAFGNIFGVGGSAYIARSLGEGKTDKVKRISSFSVYCSIISGAILMAVILLGMNTWLKLLGSTTNTIGFANDYMKYIALGGPFIVTSISVGNLVRGEGAAKVSMVGMMIGTITNIILDPIMIITLKMGVGGAAIATVISNIASVVYYAIYLIKGNSILSCNPKKFSVKDGIFTNVVPIGVPAALNNVLMSLSNIVLNNFLKGYGESAVAALGIAMKVNMLVVFLQMGIGIGIQPLIGYSFGARNIERLKKTMRFSMMCTLVIGVVVTALYLIFTNQIIELFSKDPEVIKYGHSILWALMISGPFIGIMFIYNFAFQGIGKAVPSFILSIGRQGLIFLPLLIIMSKIKGFDGIIFAQPVADLVCLVGAALMFQYVKKHFLSKISPLENKNNG